MDIEQLDQVRAVVKTRWPEMVEAYLEEAAMYIENIKKSIVNDDKQGLASNAHPLKSSSNSLGIFGLGEIAETLEYDAKEAIETGADISHLKELTPLLEEAYKHAEPLLRKTLSDNA
jgi:HPt (histidine-containing phosphotransfer) domain-containing protein